MTEVWVVNASPIILLNKVNQISLLQKLNENFIIPLEVEREIQAGPDNDSAKKWLETQTSQRVASESNSIPQIISWDLGRGETGVISLCYQKPDCVAVLDDKAARRCAQAFGVKTRGTVGIILLAKQKGLIPKAKPIFEKLIESGLYLSQDFVNQCLSLVGE